MATIMIPTPLRKFTEQRSTLEAASITVKSAIDQLIHLYPSLQHHLLDKDDQIRSFVRIFVGDTDYAELDGPDTAVDDQTVISIVPAIAGGIPDLDLSSDHADR
ncbi:MAG: MoaD/ThiS family protein [Saprospiraceae bacterium]|nr:MoaD/ThiS family protein [Saprospiraceae bacterium]